MTSTAEGVPDQPGRAGVGAPDHSPEATRAATPRAGRGLPPWLAPGWRQDVGVVAVVYLALAVLGALVWWLLVDPAVFTKTDSGGLAMSEVELAKRFNDDGWFAVIGGVLGLLSGSALAWYRSRDPLLTAALVLVCSSAAGGAMALLGRLLGPAAPDSVASTAPVGATVPVQLEVTAAVSYLVWPITAMLGVLVVLWSPAPDARDEPHDSTETDAGHR
jgi:hypothetical protein